MKRNSTTLLRSALAVAFVCSQSLNSAHAAPRASVDAKLNAVPVFILTNADGAPLVTDAGPGGQNSPVSIVFMTPSDAQDMARQIGAKNSALVGSLQVKSITLADMFKAIRDNAAKPDGVAFNLVPDQAQVANALTLLHQAGGSQKSLQGVPLFAVQWGTDKTYITVDNGAGPRIPMFFSLEQAQAMAAQYAKAQTDSSGPIAYQVLDLAGLVDHLEAGYDPILENVMLVPSKASIDFAQSLETPKSPAPPDPSPPTK